MIYFVQVDPCGPVKIGVARDVEARLRELQCGCPVELVVRDTRPGGLREEREWHQKLAPFRLRGEWFSPNEVLVSLVPMVVPGPSWKHGQYTYRDVYQYGRREGWEAAQRALRHPPPMILRDGAEHDPHVRDILDKPVTWWTALWADELDEEAA